MKRTVIGGILMLSGILMTLTIIVSATLYARRLTSWSNSKLWYAVFDELSLDIPFGVGIIITVVGLIILAKEYFTLKD